jgi:dephospho-CoA kinase
MLKVGLTGNIGSGKTVVAGIFTQLGIPVFYADSAARDLYERTEVKAMLRGLFGDEIFDNAGNLNRKALADLVFADALKLQKLNQIVHPLVREAFGRWLLERKDSPYVLYEAAILFESGYYRDLDKVILVMAPEELRIRRVMERDYSTRDEIMARLARQWGEEKKVPMADFIINNNGTQMLIPQVMEVHRQLVGSH